MKRNASDAQVRLCHCRFPSLAESADHRISTIFIEISIYRQAVFRYNPRVFRSPRRGKLYEMGVSPIFLLWPWI
jgi:hypothetical protein